MKKYTKKSIIEEVIKKGFVLLDDGDLKLTVVKMNTEECEMPEKLEAQLKEEGLYNNSYAAAIIPVDLEKCSIDYLPIYGNSEKYITRHLLRDKESAIEILTNDTYAHITKRANEYLEKGE